MSLWSEIKQRRITQIVVAYVVGGWIVVSVIDQPVDRGVLPDVVYQVVLTLYLFGILGALIIGWYHGEKGEQKAPPIEIAMLTVIGLIAVGTSGWVVKRSIDEANLQDSLVEAGLDLRSIGVLYFEDVTRDGSGQAIAEGITEGLINTLSEVDELQVTSRNAAQAVRDLDVPVDSIATILDVGTVVDGTVDLVGDEIRVTVRLMEGQDGIQLARETYEWPADEVASVGSLLAAEVGNALREQLGVEVQLRQSQAQAPNSAAWLEMARAERAFKSSAVALAAGDGDALWAAFDDAEAAATAAQDVAPDWADPLVFRGWVAMERTKYLPTDETLEYIEEAMELANEALALEPDDVGALELRGTAEYMRFLQEVDDEDTLEQLLQSARADLERAQRLDRNRASVNSTLSHLYYQVDDWTDAVLAARAAYTQDAFLAVADDVVWRLFTASYDLAQPQQAREWCLEGRDRFPDDPRFLQCQIYAMTMEGAEPDVAEAWALYDEMVTMMPDDPSSTLVQGLTQTYIGGVIGRAELPDSADAVMTRARLGRDGDPRDEQLFQEAAMRSVSGDTDVAIQLLQRYIVGHPGHYVNEHWWWRNLQGNPEFERLEAMR